MKRAFALLVVFVLLVGGAGGLAWFQFRVKPDMIKGFIAGAGQPVAAVAATKAEAQNWTPQLQAIGSFRAIKGVEVSPQVGGLIRAIRFESAQDVQKGDILVDIDDSTEQADLKSSLAALQMSALTFDRQNQLITGGTTSKANLDQARASRDQAAAQVERIKAVIAQKMVAAPFAGRLGIRRVDVGQYISPGTALVTLQQLDPIYVDFQMPEQNLAVLAVDQQVDVSVDAFPGKVFSGKVRYLDARVSPDTRNFLVRAEVQNQQKTLLPGMFAKVTVRAGQPEKVVTVPRTSVAYSLYGDTVFALKPLPPASGAAQAAPAGQSDQLYTVDRRIVTVGAVQEGRVSIIKGLDAGETVVTEGQVKLQPGAKVKVDAKASMPPMNPMPKE